MRKNGMLAMAVMAAVGLLAGCNEAQEIAGGASLGGFDKAGVQSWRVPPPPGDDDYHENNWDFGF